MEILLASRKDQISADKTVADNFVPKMSLDPKQRGCGAFLGSPGEKGIIGIFGDR